MKHLGTLTPSPKRLRFFLYLYALIFFLLTTALLLNRFWQFEVFYFDHGIFDQALWKVSQLQAPLIDHLESKPIHQLGDHFNPTFYLLSPLYLITDSYEAILIIQALSVSVSLILLFHLGKLLLPHKESIVLACVIAFSLFIGFQNAVLAQLHPEIFAIPLFIILLLTYEKKMWVTYWVILFLLIGLKEVFAAPIATLGVIMFLGGEKKRGLLTIFIASLWFITVTKIVMPAFAGREYQYAMQLDISNLHPFKLLNSIDKRTTIFTSLTHFALLPLFSGISILLLLQDLVVRMVLSNGPAYWDLGLHYSALMSVILVYLSFLGFKKLDTMKWIGATAVIVYLVCMPFWLNKFIFPLPLGLTLNPTFYKHTENFSFLEDFIKSLPEGKTIMTMNNLAPHITHHNQVLLLRQYYWLEEVDIIAIDSRSGQNPNNFWPLPQNQFNELIEKLESDQHYHTTHINSHLKIFTKRYQ